MPRPVVPVLRFYKLSKDVPSPAPATQGSACFDLGFYPIEDTIKGYDKTNKPIERALGSSGVDKPKYLTIMPGDRFLVPTGLILDIPEGYSVRIHPRSSLSFKRGLTLANGEGVIDWDYVEPLYALITNNSNIGIPLEVGDRIIQAELVKMNKLKIVEISEKPLLKTDRNGGYGSTGTK